jgi:DNA-binding GntR family transcriptional regulator
MVDGTAGKQGRLSTAPQPASEESLGQQIYRGIRGKIINGTLAQGSRLRERELAEEFRVSRVPLREAFPQLEADGFIQSSLRRGVRVTSLTLKDVDDLFEARLGMEVYATRLAAARVAAGASVEALEAALRAAEDAYATKDPDLIAEANVAVHDEIVRLAGNSLLSTMMHAISGRYRWIFRMTYTPEIAGSGDEHREIFEAIRNGDPDLAGAIALVHVAHGRQPTLAMLAGTLPRE